MNAQPKPTLEDFKRARDLDRGCPTYTYRLETDEHGNKVLIPMDGASDAAEKLKASTMETLKILSDQGFDVELGFETLRTHENP